MRGDDHVKVGKNPTNRGKIGTKRSLLTDGGVPIVLVVEGSNRNDFGLDGRRNYMANKNIMRRRAWEWKDVMLWILIFSGGPLTIFLATVVPSWLSWLVMAFGLFLILLHVGKCGFFIIGPKASGLGALIFLFGSYLLTRADWAWPLQVGAWLLLSCLSLMWSGYRKTEASEIQSVRDQRAREIFTAVKEGKRPRYTLYLRPSITRNRLLIQMYSGRLTEEDSGSEEIDLETILALSFPRSMPIIGLGTPGEILEGGSWSGSIDSSGIHPNFSFAPGVGMIKTTAGMWRWDFKRLANSAELLLIIPYAYEGTMYELKEIKENEYLDKCIFIMPETLDGGTWHKEQWEKGMEKVKQLGIELPPYERRGMLFKVSQDGCVTDAFKLNANLGRAPRVQRLIKRLSRNIEDRKNKSGSECTKVRKVS
jgi:hypothetical protein